MACPNCFSKRAARLLHPSRRLQSRLLEGFPKPIAMRPRRFVPLPICIRQLCRNFLCAVQEWRQLLLPFGKEAVHGLAPGCFYDVLKALESLAAKSCALWRDSALRAARHSLVS